MSTWWPLESHHIAEVKAVDAVMEPFSGGRWYEVGEDGSQCDWGRVRAYEPPRRILLGWHLDADWKYDPDESRSSEIEVRLEPEGPSTTRVELEHRGLEAHGKQAQEVRDAIGSDGGRPGLLRLFQAAAAG
jgi:uncharacterized protein YndB with AHSA1/START domain